MKKAQFNIAMEMPVWFLRIGILILILVVITAGISTVLTRKIEVKKFESQLILYNIYNCLSFENHMGVIDSNKLNNLENCFDFSNLEIELKFRDLDGNIINEKAINGDKFKVDWPLCNLKIENENFFCYTIKDYLIMDDKPAVLEYSIINPGQKVILQSFSGGSTGGGGAGRSY